VPGQAPQQLTDEIRKQVETDVRLRKAFDLAYQRADRIRTVEQFNAADANGEANAIATGLFSRRSPGGGPVVPPELNLPPVEFVQKAFIDSAFSLAPGASMGSDANRAEPASAPSSPTIGLLRMPAMRQVLVMKRTNYEPLTRDLYVQQYRMEIVRFLSQTQNQLCLQVWFAPPAIQQRVSYVPEAGAKGKPSEGGPEQAPAEPTESF
jgi:hypothetical protein